MSPLSRRPGPLDWALLGILGFIWGGSFMGIELALGALAPLWVAATRVCIAAVLVFGVCQLFGDGLPRFRTPLERRVWLHCIGMGLFTNAFPFTLLAWGQQYVTSSFAGISMAVMPLLVLPLSHALVPGERMTAWRLGGFLVGFAGVALLIGGDSLFALFADMGAGTGRMEVNAGQIACILASCCYAVGAIITRLSPAVSPLSFSAAGLVSAGLVLLPVALLVSGAPGGSGAGAADTGVGAGVVTGGGPTLFGIDALSFAGIVYLALFSTGLATIIRTVLIMRAGPPFVSLVNYQVPVWAVLIGLALLGEDIPGHFIPALALILSGLALSQLLHRRARD